MKKYEAQIYGFIEEINDATNFEDLNASFGNMIGEFGFDKWGCIQISAAKKHIKSPLRRAFGNIPDGWFNHYRDNNFIFDDYAAKMVMDLQKPFWWSEIIETFPLEKKQVRIFEEAKAFGHDNGFAVPLKFADGSIWSCLLTSNQDTENHEIKDALNLAAQFFARRGMYLKSKSEIIVKEYKLTKRQRQIVELLRYGNTQAECAHLLQISHSTVFNQTNEAKERMSCKTIAELVAESILHGEIDL